MGLTGRNMPNSHIAHPWTAHPETGTGNIAGGLAWSCRRKLAVKLSSLPISLGLTKWWREAIHKDSGKQKGAFLGLPKGKEEEKWKKKPQTKPTYFDEGSTHWMRTKPHLDQWRTLVSFCHQDIVIRLDFKYVCMWSAAQWNCYHCDYLLQQYSFLSLLLRLLQHYLRDSILHPLCAGRNDCNIEYQLDNKSAAMCGRGFTAKPSVAVF